MVGQEETSGTQESGQPNGGAPKSSPGGAPGDGGGPGGGPASTGPTWPGGGVKGIVNVLGAGKRAVKGPAKAKAVVAPANLEDNLRALEAESQALADYLSRRGSLLTAANNGEQVYDNLVSAIAEARTKRTKAKWASLMKAYRAATAITYPEQAVNGMTIQHTLHASPIDKRNRPLVIGVVLFALAMGLEGFAVWLGEAPAGISAELRTVSIALVQFLIPACWGGIGACTFLVKRLTDVLGKMSFDADRLRGDTTRIFLGAMIGAIVVVLFFPQYGKDITVGSATFGPATAAFLAGLGTKVVYGAFETLVEGLAKRLSGAASK